MNKTIIYFFLCVSLYNTFYSVLIWIGLDGFRPDYLNKELTPNMYKKFVENGVVSMHHESSFITKTFPNHFSQVTGLTQEHHGIINNNMYDKDLGEFHMGNVDIEWWDPYFNNTPIWTLNQFNKGSSAIIYWPGGSVPFKGVVPNYYFKVYNFGCDVSCRIDLLIEQVKTGKHNLIMMYTSEIDSYGHDFGPDSKQRLEMTFKVDRELGRLFKELERMNLIDSVDIMVSSDHGMTLVQSENHIDVSERLSGFSYRIINTGTVYQIDCDMDTALAILEILKLDENIAEVYLKDEFPDYLNYKNSDRVPILSALPKDHYVIVDKMQYNLIGDHGYTVEISPNMLALFAISGPSVNKDAILEKSEQIDLFKIACELIGLFEKCDYADGKIPKGLLKSERKSGNLAVVIAVPIVVSALVIVAIGLGVYFGLKRKSRK